MTIPASATGVAVEIRNRLAATVTRPDSGESARDEPKDGRLAAPDRP